MHELTLELQKQLSRHQCAYENLDSIITSWLKEKAEELIETRQFVREATPMIYKVLGLSPSGEEVKLKLYCHKHNWDSTTTDCPFHEKEQNEIPEWQKKILAGQAQYKPEEQKKEWPTIKYECGCGNRAEFNPNTSYFNCDIRCRECGKKMICNWLPEVKSLKERLAEKLLFKIRNGWEQTNKLAASLADIAIEFLKVEK